MHQKAPQRDKNETSAQRDAITARWL